MLHIVTTISKTAFIAVMAFTAITLMNQFSPDYLTPVSLEADALKTIPHSNLSSRHYASSCFFGTTTYTSFIYKVSRGGDSNSKKIPKSTSTSKTNHRGKKKRRKHRKRPISKVSGSTHAINQQPCMQISPIKRKSSKKTKKRPPSKMSNTNNCRQPKQLVNTSSSLTASHDSGNRTTAVSSKTRIRNQNSSHRRKRRKKRSLMGIPTVLQSKTNEFSIHDTPKITTITQKKKRRKKHRNIVVPTSKTSPDVIELDTSSSIEHKLLPTDAMKIVDRKRKKKRKNIHHMKSPTSIIDSIESIPDNISCNLQSSLYVDMNPNDDDNQTISTEIIMQQSIPNLSETIISLESMTSHEDNLLEDASLLSDDGSKTYVGIPEETTMVVQTQEIIPIAANLTDVKTYDMLEERQTTDSSYPEEILHDTASSRISSNITNPKTSEKNLLQSEEYIQEETQDQSTTLITNIKYPISNEIYLVHSKEYTPQETVDNPSQTAILFADMTHQSNEIDFQQSQEISPTNLTSEESHDNLPEEEEGYISRNASSEVDRVHHENAEDQGHSSKYITRDEDNEQIIDEEVIEVPDEKVERTQNYISTEADGQILESMNVDESYTPKNDTDVRGGDVLTVKSKAPSLPVNFQEETKPQSITWIVESPSIDEADMGKQEITVSVVTWNLGEQSPTETDMAFLKRFRKSNKTQGLSLGSDLVMIGCQETENTKPRRTEGHRSRELRRLEIKMMGKRYVPLALHSLGGVQFALFCRRNFLNEVELVRISDVACGVGNVFHNKGAIGAFVQLKARNSKDSSRSQSIKMLFVISHLAAHVKNFEERNADYWRILSELEAAAPPRFLNKQLKGSDELSSESQLMESMDRVFWAGDLNYRLDLPREYVERTILKIQELQQNEHVYSKGEISTLMKRLLRHDQLLRSISEGSAFIKLTEGRISFIPTFKFDKGTLSYDSSKKQRIPAWTDRILFKPKGTRVLEYTSVLDATHSDHRPVFATFKVNMEGR